MIWRQITRRILHSVVLLIVISASWFALLALSPGDYFDEQRLDPRVSPETVAKLRKQYGLTKPWWVRYGDWSLGMLRGEMGVSMVYNQPVSTLVLPRVGNTLLLTTAGTLLAWVIALPLGLWAGAQRQTVIDFVLSFGAGLALAIPELLLATLLVFWAGTSGVWPSGGMRSNEQGEWADVLRHLILPAGVLAVGLFPVLFQHLRSAVREAAGLPFVRVAKAMGVPAWQILWRSVLPVAANPMLSLFGLSLAGLLSSSLLVEVIFGWPGLGPLFVEAVMNKDTYLVLAPVMLAALALAVGNLLADLLLMWNDPRIREEAR